ncbi:hypothetical protein VN97_g10151 [Penicillium thymicola]|uniref:Uncharacterized protein n=1 Tax=Penicillium thymicola TaxID=293382 RepID=A0AAI9TA78_PENTH|nr:hypothetical protein VN97_g10151 [Penicillium thymicola]
MIYTSPIEDDTYKNGEMAKGFEALMAETEAGLQGPRQLAQPEDLGEIGKKDTAQRPSPLPDGSSKPTL